MKKSELVAALESSRKTTAELIADFTDQDMTALVTSEGWSLKDIISHLVRWEAELVKLLWQLRQGQRPTSIHFLGATVDEINARWKEEDSTRPLEQILADFQTVRRQSIRRIESFTEQELNDDQRYPWLKGKTLADWIAEDSFEHETEHLAQIEQLRSLQL